MVEGVVSYNPASSVKGPKHSAKRGKTPVLIAADIRRLFEFIKLEFIKDYRDRAIVGVLLYAWVRMSVLAGWMSATTATWARTPSYALRRRAARFMR